MNTKNKLLVAGSAVLAVVLLSGFAGGSFGFGCNGRDPERVNQLVTWKLNDRLDELKATEEQRQAFHGLKDSLFEDGKGLFAEQQGAKAQLLEQWESPNPNAQAVHALVDSRVDAFRAFAHKLADAALEAHRILTPEQRQQVTAGIRERMNAR